MEQASRGRGATAPRPELAYYQDLFPLLFASAVDGICLTTTDGRVYAANPAACRIFGRSEEEICRLGRDALLNLADPRLAVAMEERRRTGRGHAELTVLRPDGTVVPIELTSTVLGDPGGDSPAVIVFRDVSERVRDREALAGERALLEGVFASLDDAVIVSDTRTHRVLRANPTVERILGWRPDELVGRPMADVHRTAAEHEVTARRAREAWAAEGSFSAEVELLRRDGASVPVRFFSRPVPGAGHLAVAVLHDLTGERGAAAERDRLQEILLQAQKLEGLAPPAAAAEPPAPAPSRAGGGRVLVVDDEALVRRTARRLLEKAGYEVVEAADGAEALERFQAARGSFDAILLDLSMPRMSGQEAFAALRGIRADVPVVLSSGYAPDDGLERLLRDPHVRFASKPYDRRALVEAVAAAVGGGPARG